MAFQYFRARLGTLKLLLSRYVIESNEHKKVNERADSKEHCSFVDKYF